jgi:esterase/lipase
VKFFSEKFASAGFHVLSYDYRAHGVTAEVTGKNWLKYLPKIFSDIHSVIDWICSYDAKGDIVLFGRSLGGAIILTHGFKDNRAKKLIALCTRYDYHSFKKVPFPEKTIKLISPIYFLEKHYQNPYRILLAHCKDDKQIPFENLQHIKNHLELPPKNTLIYEKGGHSFKDHREDILNKAIEFMKE